MKEAADPRAAPTVLASLLQARTGQVISPDRFWRIETALNPIMRHYAIPDLDALVAVLLSGHNEALLRDAIEAMLNNESFFFRDVAMFEMLRVTVLPRLQEQRARERKLRIWSAGCSTGQEAYSLAMMIKDQRDRWSGWDIEIVGTDVSQSVIEKARSGRYSQFEIQRGLAVTTMLRYFREDGEDWVLERTVQQMVRFERDNLLDAQVNIGQFDLVLCRNVLMYFSPEMRRAAYMRIHRAMRSDAMLMLGASETVLGEGELFETARDVRGIYRPAAGGGSDRAAVASAG